LISDLLGKGHDFPIVPQTLAEFIHIVSDSSRMPNPLSLVDAVSRAQAWWNATEVQRIFPEGQTVQGFFTWLRQYRLGRKRLLDTMLASTFRNRGITKVVFSYTLTVGETKVVIHDKKLSVNGVAYGPLDKGDSITIDPDSVTVAGEVREPLL